MDESRREAEPPRPLDARSQFRRDRDRILYSSYFARLAETTQVVSPERGYVFHNRLTHSLKVAQIARTIAEFFLNDHEKKVEALGGIDPDAAEAAGLAHDLGHPPFGHIAEQELNRLVTRAGAPDGYEGNAQSLRIVYRLAASDAFTKTGEQRNIQGLNLTRSTVNGIIKYPWRVGENVAKRGKWGYYSEERDYFVWARQGCSPQQRSLIAEVMDWSDDVTYAIHDVLDFYRAGLIPLEAIQRLPKKRSYATVERETFLRRVFTRQAAWMPRRRAYIAALDSILELLPFDYTRRYTGTEGEEQSLYHFSTALITKYVTAIAPSDGGDSFVVVQQRARDEVDVLKEFVWAYVINNPDLAILQAGQRRAIRAVFTALLRAAQAGRVHFFSAGFRDRVGACTSKPARARVVADYVAGMTERELIRTYRRLQAIVGE